MAKQATFPKPPKLPINTDSLLILEKTFEINQLPIENLNLIEQLLIRVTENINLNYPSLVSNYIVRRFPTYTIPYFNKNDYAVVLSKINHVLTSPNPSVSDSVSVEGKPVKINIGQIEVYKAADESPLSDLQEIINEDNAFCSHEIFKKYASAFLKTFTAELDRKASESEADDQEQLQRKVKEKVQMVGPHLLHQLKCYPEIDQIFTLTQPDIPTSPSKKALWKIEVDRLKSILTIKLDGTEVTLRPCLFMEKGYPKINISLLERIPLFHPSVILIGTSLTKGCLLFPTNFETLWTIQFWPSESHILSTFHPSSIISRVFKLYGSFCVNPIHFSECLNTCFLVGVEDTETLAENLGNNIFPTDFLTSSFLQELEHFPEIEDWAPKNFSHRFTNLLNSAVNSCDKGFHAHYFTRSNVLRSMWKASMENIDLEEKYALRELDDIEEFGAGQGQRSPSPTEPREVYKERKASVDFEENQYDLEDEFGLHFESLSINDEDDLKPKMPGGRSKSLFDPSTTESREGLSTTPSRSRSLSKFLGENLMRRFSMLGKGIPDENGTDQPGPSRARPKSMADITSGFEQMVNLQRREQNLQLQDSSNEDDVFTSTLAFAETTFNEPKDEPFTSTAFDNEGFSAKESIYSSILQILDVVSPSVHDTEIITHIDTSRKVLASQGELINSWIQIISEIPKPKHVCPHAFSLRQIQYISLVIQVLSKCTPNGSHSKSAKAAQMPAWEISGDILRTVLCQMRAETAKWDSVKEKRKDGPVLTRIKKLSFRTSQSFSEGSKPQRRTSKFSFRSGSYDVCKGHLPQTETDLETETELALEDPETAATHRLLKWLWQLRNSEIGRLSNRAKKYIEALHHASLINSHFMDQFKEQKVVEGMAIRSAVAVSRIMRDEKFPAHVPLVAATKRGWLWSEMVLSLISWNRDKGYIMLAEVPLNVTQENMQSSITREINMRSLAPELSALNKMKCSTEPDTEAVNLAFHSELATPLGWNDFEDPRSPGPFTVPILIFSSMNYFRQWELVPGNIVQVLVRLQKFSILQHIGTMLLSPHRKAALNEVRKLNKSLSFHTFQFDENVMTKTFRRLASLRHTRRFLTSVYPREETQYTCHELGCKENSPIAISTLNTYRGKDIECTRM